MVFAHRQKDRKQVKRDLETVFEYFPKIKSLYHRTSGYLSGGEQQMLVIGRALMARPRLMLLDEPFGALDPVTRDSLQTEFKTLQKSLGFTAVLVTHDMAEALILADRIAVMKAGSIIRMGTPNELLDEPGDEYVAALLETPRRHVQLLTDLERN